jgi:hypothetical protein
MNINIKMALAAVILAVGMFFSAAVLSKFFVRIRHEKTLEVKGFSETNVISDIGRFTCRIQFRGAGLKEAYEGLQAGRSRVQVYLAQRGFKPGEISTEPVEVLKVARRDDQGREMNEVEFYDGTQNLVVESGDVERIRDAAIAINELIREGIDLRVFDPEFYVSDLKDVKVALLSRATEDGYERAEALARNSKGKVGSLVSAQQGVFQITRQNSTDTSGYGLYDTTTIKKTAKAVVTLEYAIATEK